MSDETQPKRRTRRSLLGLFGAGAVGVAAGKLVDAPNASAAGPAITAGDTTTATGTTELTTDISDSAAFVVQAPNANWAVEADGGQIGVLGDAYFGVVGSGQVGGFFSGTLAPISLKPQLDSGAPTSGAYSMGDMIVDSNGDLYLCQTGGNPGTWTRVTGGSSGSGSTGGGLNLLDAAVRFYDSRSSGGPFAANEERSLTIGGLHGVPSNATAVVGNIAVTGTVDSGNALVYPAGISRPNAASINWFASNQTLNNALTVKLGAGGAVTLYAAATTQIIVDITGYVL